MRASRLCRIRWRRIRAFTPSSRGPRSLLFSPTSASGARKCSSQPSWSTRDAQARTAAKQVPKFDTYPRHFLTLTHIPPFWRIYGSGTFLVMDELASRDKIKDRTEKPSLIIVICRIKNTVCQIICDAAKRFQQMASAS